MPPLLFWCRIGVNTCAVLYTSLHLMVPIMRILRKNVRKWKMKKSEKCPEKMKNPRNMAISGENEVVHPAGFEPTTYRLGGENAQYKKPLYIKGFLIYKGENFTLLYTLQREM